MTALSASPQVLFTLGFAVWIVSAWRYFDKTISFEKAELNLKRGIIAGLILMLLAAAVQYAGPHITHSQSPPRSRAPSGGFSFYTCYN